ncbi:two pore domain potassium channel family protein [Planococcus sp. CPCC 101016]|uniref:potassium channel family protein n=1 Tax=Planococcus sp. CPCC 101016 TaxID=2599617 RepID=UPI0011B64943|nr:potassium channel family protein [Planococcus sp. CPCC 101016]TWT07562.1 two pore domain potassium channel family protein [Planococcus sp. CPCC 101016]
MKKSIFFYEMGMACLIITSLFLAFSDYRQQFLLFDWMIWGIFVIDFMTRLILSKNKWAYIKSHPLELIAILPLDSIFRAARFARFFRVIRLLGIGSRYTKPVYQVLRTNGLDKLLVVTTVLLFLVPIPIIMVEPDINTFSDALWWAVVTTTTVGYGDISPATPIGRFLAVLLMIIGIGIIGTFTSSISAYFTSKKEPTQQELVITVIEAINKMETISTADQEVIQNYLDRKNQ